MKEFAFVFYVNQHFKKTKICDLDTVAHKTIVYRHNYLILC